MSDLQIRDIAILHGASEEFFTKLESVGNERKLDKGKIVFIHEEQAENFYILTAGWVKLFRETADGAQSIIDILPAGHTFGETPIFEDGLYPYSAEIVEPSVVISAPLSLLKEELQSNNELSMNMLKHLIRYKRGQDRELEHMTVQNAPQRIGCFLMRLADSDSKGPVTIHLPYDKTLLAARLGMQPETFSRALAKLKEQTGIRVKGAVVELDNLEQLINYSCQVCSSEFPCKDVVSLK